jgi:hypothetical protein
MRNTVSTAQERLAWLPSLSEAFQRWYPSPDWQWTRQKRSSSSGKAATAGGSAAASNEALAGLNELLTPGD